MSTTAQERDASVVNRFVTLGDSITAGIPMDDCSLWPQLVTNWLATHTSDVRHLNLAVGGATSRDVLRDQVPLALQSQPDLVTVICGANDVLRCPRPDIEAAGKYLTECLELLAEEIAPGQIVTATYPDFAAIIPWRPRSRARVATAMKYLNELIRLASHEVDVLCVDLELMSQSGRDAVYAPDGIHPAQIGHRWIAVAMTAAIATKLELPDVQSYWEAM